MPHTNEQLAWRSATPGDDPLLFELFAAAKGAEFAPLGLAEEQLRPLLTMQFRARQSGYAQQFPDALDMIVTVTPASGPDAQVSSADAEASGSQAGKEITVARHLIERRSDCYRGIDLAVLPAWRNRGIGTWALRQVQNIAAVEGVPFRLRVLRSNRARALYERLGFLLISADDVSFEMEWTAPAAAATTGGAPQIAATVPTAGGTLPREDVLDRITSFLRGIGIGVECNRVPNGSFLPGLQLVRNGLRVDPETLVYPGDLLHEAGHLALMTPDRRSADLPVAADPAEEMGALAWSYAAAIHLGLPTDVVFHADGYKGQSQSLIAEFRDNPQPLGVPFLAWLGLTTMPFPGSPSIFPQMLRWLREAKDGQVADTADATDEAIAAEAIPELPWIRLPFRFDVERLQGDVASIPETDWQPHFNRADYHGEWSSVALRSRSGNTSDIVPVGDAPDFQDTPLLARLPAVRTVLQHFDFPLKSVRLMRLHAGSEILEHRDRDLTLKDGELRLHIPVFTSDAVEFYLAGERLPLRAGECWYIDFSQPHRIVNSGRAHRTHLVIDGVANDAALRLLRDANSRGLGTPAGNAPDQTSAPQELSYAV